MPIIIDKLNFTYSPKTVFAKDALKDITVTVNDGDFLGIIGHTGSGKSTFVQHLNGLIKLQSGSITVDGIDLSRKYDYKKLRSTVGMVFQYPEYQLFDETVEKDISFGPRNLGLSPEEISTRVREAIRTVGLDFDAVKDRSPFELSGGQKRRVALAGVLAMRPKILVLDEPTAGLDPRGKQSILGLIKDIQRTTTPTIIMISHNMDEINSYASRVIVFNKGALLYDSTPKELFKEAAPLTSIGLAVPTPVRIRNSLQAQGVRLDGDTHLTEGLIEAVLNRYKGGLQ